MKIGFIGLGIMGSRMAANLLKKGHQLKVYNRSREKVNGLIAAGAKWSETPSGVAEGAEVLITMLADPEAVAGVALGADGFLNNLAEGALWIDCSTVHPSFARKMAGAAGQNGIAFIDAPVAGSKPQAEQGALVFFAGGSAADIEKASELFEAMGQKTLHIGAAGQGTAIKMVINQLLANSMAGFAEGLQLGESLGLARKLLLDVLIGGPVVPPYMAMKKENFERNQYEAAFPLKLMSKDMRMVATAAGEQGLHQPLAAATAESYAGAVAAGFGELDFSGIAKNKD